MTSAASREPIAIAAGPTASVCARASVGERGFRRVTWVLAFIAASHASTRSASAEDASADDASGASAPDVDTSRPAQDPRYARHMALAIRLFEDRNYDAAITEFERAYAVLPKASPLVNIALCHKGRFAYVKAIALLERALAEHADTVDQPDTVRRAIAEMRELLASVHVVLSPADAEDLALEIDDEVVDAKVARGPIALSPGAHTIVARAAGHAEARVAIRVGSGDEARVDIQLTPNAGRLDIAVTDSGALVLVDDELRPTVWQGFVAPGTHALQIKTSQGDVYTTTVSSAMGATQTIRLGDDGLLRIGDKPPVGADGSEERSGPYGLLAFVTYNLTDGDGPKLGFAGDARVGYRFSRVVGGELRFHQGFAALQEARVATTQAGANVRLMTVGEPLRFVGTVGFGVAYDSLSDIGPAGESRAAGAYALVEPAAELDFGGILLGLGLGFTGAVTTGGASAQFGAVLRGGYGFW